MMLKPPYMEAEPGNGGEPQRACRSWNRDAQAPILLQLLKKSMILDIPPHLSKPQLPIFQMGPTVTKVHLGLSRQVTEAQVPLSNAPGGRWAGQCKPAREVAGGSRRSLVRVGRSRYYLMNLAIDLK